MSAPLVTLRWSYRCNHCGHSWEETQTAEAAGIEYEAPPVPRRCENCGKRLRRVPMAWRRTFQITKVVE